MPKEPSARFWWFTDGPREASGRALFGSAVIAIAVLTLVIPFVPAATAIGFATPPLGMVFLFFGIAALYFATLELVERASWSGFDRRSTQPSGRVSVGDAGGGALQSRSA